MVQGHTKIPGGECHRHGKRFGREAMRFGISIIFGIFGMDASRCADKIMVVLLCMHSGFPTEILEQTIVTSLYDVTRVFMLQWEGTIKGEHNLTLGLLAVSAVTVVWVFQHKCLGL